MAELTTFGFYPGTSPLHQLDARFKIILLVSLSFMGLNARFGGLATVTLLLFLSLRRARLPIISGLRELRYFLLLLFFIFIARALSTGGIPLIDFGFIRISLQGLYEGALVCWRLALVVLLGFGFIASTRPSEIKSAIQWFLKPVPFVSEQKVAIMLSLIMRFVPVIFAQAAETAEAQKARGIDNRKNPAYRLIKLGIPLIRRTFEKADDLAVAMEARCYTEKRTDPELKCRRRDWIVLIAVGALAVSLYYI